MSNIVSETALINSNVSSNLYSLSDVYKRASPETWLRSISKACHDFCFWLSNTVSETALIILNTMDPPSVFKIKYFVIFHFPYPFCPRSLIDMIFNRFRFLVGSSHNLHDKDPFVLSCWVPPMATVKDSHTALVSPATIPNRTNATNYRCYQSGKKCIYWKLLFILGGARSDFCTNSEI